MSKKVKNKFGADVAKGGQKNYNQRIHLNSTLNSPVWYNITLAFQYRKDRANTGYWLIKDLLDEEGRLLALDEFVVRGLKLNYLDYITLKLNFQKTKVTFQDMEQTRTYLS